MNFHKLAYRGPLWAVREREAQRELMEDEKAAKNVAAGDWEPVPNWQAPKKAFKFKAKKTTEPDEPLASRAGKATGKAARTAGKGAWSVVKTPLLFGSGLVSGLAASKTPFAERAGKKVGEVVGGVGRFFLDKAGRVGRAATRAHTYGSIGLRAYDAAKGAAKGLIKKGEHMNFKDAFQDEIEKIAGVSRSLPRSTEEDERAGNRQIEGA